MKCLPAPSRQRIDHRMRHFTDRLDAEAALSVKIPDTRVNGIYPSDHHPVIAVSSVN